MDNKKGVQIHIPYKLLIGLGLIAAFGFGYVLSNQLNKNKRNEIVEVIPQIDTVIIEKKDTIEVTKIVYKEKPQPKSKSSQISNTNIAPKKISNANVSYSDVVDPANRKYRTITIGRTEWMAENLAYKVDDSFCFNGNNQSCQKFGRLYSAKSGFEACKALGLNWRLPTLKEWFELIGSLPAEPKKTNPTIDNPEGKIIKLTEEERKIAAFKGLVLGGKSGFDATFGGYRLNNGQFGNQSKLGIYLALYDRDGDSILSSDYTGYKRRIRYDNISLLVFENGKLGREDASQQRQYDYRSSLFIDADKRKYLNNGTYFSCRCVKTKKRN